MGNIRPLIAILLAWLLTLQGVWAYGGLPQAPQKTQPVSEKTAQDFTSPPSLDEVVQLPSLEIAALAEKFQFNRTAILDKVQSLKKESDALESRYKADAKAGDKDVAAREQALSKLGTNTKDPAIMKERVKLQCEIAKIRQDVTAKTFTFLQQEISLDVQTAKLNLLSEWPTDNQRIIQEVSSGVIAKRAFGNVLDIGNRGSQKPFKDQQKDVAWGQKELDAARQRNLFPKDVNDPVVKEYVNRLANNIARNSDLQVPLQVFLVQQEVRKDGKLVLDTRGQPQQVANAMALPGGPLVIFAGLVLAAQNESELAGVMAHEMAHISARHANRLANKGKTFSIVQLATMIGLQVFAPGLFYAASYLAYQLKGLLLQAIFNGLGLVFTINALGVSRDFELEADKLGMQYAWKTGYDPRGFIDLFDQMSQKEGYASRTSFFATHPAFGDRILNSLSEYKALQSVVPDRQFVTDTSEFQEVKARLQRYMYKSKAQVERDEKAPTLKGLEPTEAQCEQVLPSPPGPPAVRPTPNEAAPVPQAEPKSKQPATDQPPVLQRKDQAPPPPPQANNLAPSGCSL